MNKKRYCLWFKEKDLSIIKSIPEIYNVINEVKLSRLNSNREGTRKLADVPYLFGEIRQPNSSYILVPRVSSERRSYVPIGFISPNIIASDATLIIPNATIYEFGVLTSSIHMSWMRTVCGRLKSDYRYSGKVVYNNFPWPTPTEDQKSKIEKSAQGILDARALYQDSSLADLYDELTMPIELRKAHQANDRAVMEAYGFDKNLSEEEIVAKLFDMYASLVEKAK